jgi:transketolase
MYSRPTTFRSGTMVGPGTRDSVSPSSLHRAVLGAAESAKRRETTTKEAANKETISRDAKVKAKVEEKTKRVYLGAWP